MAKNDIYGINTAFIQEEGYTERKTVYIPYVHKSYDTYTICYIFQRLFGTVCRIDRVYNNTSNPDFISLFVYYYENNFFSETRIPNKGNKIFPRNYVPTRSIQGTKLIKETEFWIILPNQTSFEDTTKTLDELGEEIQFLEYIDLTKEEDDILKENKIYFAELQKVEKEPDYDYYHDTKINIHQLAQNLKLMRERISTSDDMGMHRSWVQLTDRRM